MSVQLAAALAEDLVRRGCPADGELLRISKKKCAVLCSLKKRPALQSSGSERNTRPCRTANQSFEPSTNSLLGPPH